MKVISVDDKLPAPNCGFLRRRGYWFSERSTAEEPALVRQCWPEFRKDLDGATSLDSTFIG